MLLTLHLPPSSIPLTLATPTAPSLPAPLYLCSPPPSPPLCSPSCFFLRIRSSSDFPGSTLLCHFLNSIIFSFSWTSNMKCEKKTGAGHGRMARGGHGLLKVSPGHVMLDPSTPCGWTTPQGGWPAAVFFPLGHPTLYVYGAGVGGRLRRKYHHEHIRNQ
jgi:hypothetical protein